MDVMCAGNSTAQAIEALVFAVDWSRVPLALPRPWDVLRSRSPLSQGESGRRRSIVDAWSSASRSEHVCSATISLSILNDFLRWRCAREPRPC